MKQHSKLDVDSIKARHDIVEVIERYLPLKKNGVEYEACCPFHTEKTPSFKVSPAKQIFHCFGCGANGDVIAFVQMYEHINFVQAAERLGAVFDSTKAPDNSSNTKKQKSPHGDEVGWLTGKPVPDNAPDPPLAHRYRGIHKQQWAYHDAEGRLLGFDRRYENSKGGKEVLPLVWAVNRQTGEADWRWMAFSEPRPLYGLERLAQQSNAPVLVVEGCKCAEVGQTELPDWVVLTWQGGAKVSHKTDWTPLAGRRVILWPDCDAKRQRVTQLHNDSDVKSEDGPLLSPVKQPGQEAMNKVAAILLQLEPPATVFMVEIPLPGEKPDGWDIADAVEEGLRGNDLAGWIKQRTKEITEVDTKERIHRDDAKGEAPNDSGNGGGKPPPEDSFQDSVDPSGPDDLDTRPVIVLQDGNMNLIVDACDELLKQEHVAYPALYQRGGAICHIVRINKNNDKTGIIRETGALAVINAEAIKICDVLMQYAKFEKYNARAEKMNRKDLPEKYAKDYMARSQWKLPILRGIVQAPLMRTDGTILTRPGYDRQTQIYFDSDGWEFDIPGPVNASHLAQAIADFRELFGEFGLDSETDFAAMLTAVLTSLMRPSFDLAPGFAVSAPVAASGKTKMTKLVGIIATGRNIAVLSHADNDEEFRKRLFAALMAGDSNIVVDNIEQPLHSEALCVVLTTPNWSERELGKSNNISVQTNRTFFVTGNNLIVQGDLVTRFIPINLSPECERPQDRIFKIDDIEAYTMRNRVKLVKAGLTILKHYADDLWPTDWRTQDGQVREMPPLGRFPEWAKYVRNAVIYAGLEDPCGRMVDWEQTDTVRMNLRRLMLVWFDTFGSTPMKTGEVIKKAQNEPGSDLADVLTEVCADRAGRYSARILGRFVVKHLKRIECGLRFRKSGVDHHALLFTVEKC